ncbi:flagellar biosynthesis protein FlgJ [Craterilacuibacter sp.]|uniref:flagellar biosynthesis protein FlgJ n=1 Tax=Craterilacuibacter sp. TaxID=2870909 RepID=UPI003F2C20E0
MLKSTIESATALPSGLAAEDGPPPAAADEAWRQKAIAAAEAFEAVFVREMLKDMDKGTQAIGGEEGLFGKPAGNELSGVAQMAVADQLARSRAFGVADAILRQLLPPTAVPASDASAVPLKKVSLPVALAPQGVTVATTLTR